MSANLASHQSTGEEPMVAVRNDAPRIDVVCAGSPAQQGAAQGEALALKLQQAALAIYKLEAMQLQKPWWLPLRGFVRVAEIKARRALQSGLHKALPGLWERLTAMSTASGVSLSRLALLNAMEAVLSDLSGSVVTGAEAGCSAVAIPGTRTTSAGPILAHNFDYLPIVQPFYVVRDERPAGGLRSLQFTAAPLVGAIDGINEAGLALTYNYAYATDRGSPGPTLSMWLSDVLANCRTAAQAVRRMSAATRWGSGLIMLADAEGDCVSLELSRTTQTARRSPPGTAVYHANRYCTSLGCAVQLPTDSVHGPRSPAALRGRRVHASSEQRESRLAALFGETEPLSPESIATRMGDHGANGIPSADTLCMHSDYWHTTACVQLLPAQRRMRIAYAPACAAQYAEFAL